MMNLHTPSNIFVACSLLGAAILGGPLRADDALNYVAEAFKAQQAAYPRKVAMTHKLGAAEFSTEIIQQSKSRVKLKTNSNGVEKEFLMIDTKIYVKSGASWHASEAPIRLPDDPVPIDSLRRLVFLLSE